MRKKTERTPGTNGPRHIIHRGLIAKADIPRAESASTECALDNRSHRTSRVSAAGTGMPRRGASCKASVPGHAAYPVRSKPLLEGFPPE